jgi:hypothetical protein
VQQLPKTSMLLSCFLPASALPCGPSCVLSIRCLPCLHASKTLDVAVYEKEPVCMAALRQRTAHALDIGVQPSSHGEPCLISLMI